jgi:hypothetical protein
MSYVFVVKLALNSKPMMLSKLASVFPRSAEATLTSREFSEYRTCVAACKELMDCHAIELSTIAVVEGDFNVAWESNPFIDGRIKSMTDDEQELHKQIWDKGEVMKMFAVNPNLRDDVTDKMFAAVSGSIIALTDKLGSLTDNRPSN